MYIQWMYILIFLIQFYFDGQSSRNFLFFEKAIGFISIK